MLKRTLCLILAASLCALALFSGCKKQNDPLEELLTLGDKYLQELDYANALLSYQKVLEVEPFSGRAIVGVFKAMTGQGQGDEALVWVENQLIQMQAAIDSAADDAEKAQLEEEKKWVEEELELNLPDDLSKELLETDSEEQLPASEAMSENLIKALECDATAVKASGEKDYATAIQKYTEVLDYWNNDHSRQVVYYNIAGCYLMQEDYANALANLQKAQEAGDTDDETQNYVDICEMKLGITGGTGSATFWSPPRKPLDPALFTE